MVNNYGYDLGKGIEIGGAMKIIEVHEGEGAQPVFALKGVGAWTISTILHGSKLMNACEYDLVMGVLPF